MSAEIAGQMRGALNRCIARGATRMIGLRLADRFLGFFSMIVLARLLVRADFGLVAPATAMIAAVGIFGEFGLDLAPLAHLVAAVLIGAPVYVGAVLLPWLFSGRPSGSPESHVLS